MSKTGDDWTEPPPAPAGQTVLETGLERAVLLLVRGVNNLTKVVMSDRRLRRFLTIVTLVALVGFSFVAWRLNSIAEQNHRIAQQNAKNGRILVECTTPSEGPKAKDPDDRVHECYENSHADTDKRVAAIVDANGNGTPDIEEILAMLGKKSTTPTTTKS